MIIEMHGITLVHVAKGEKRSNKFQVGLSLEVLVVFGILVGGY